MPDTRENIDAEPQVDLVRRLLARLEALDPHAAAELLHDDFELRWTGLGGRGHAHRGRNAFQAHLGDLSAGWEEVHVVCDHVGRSADRVLAMYHLRGHASDGSTAESPHAAMVRIRDDRVWRWDAFQDAAHSFDWLAAEARLA